MDDLQSNAAPWLENRVHLARIITQPPAMFFFFEFSLLVIGASIVHPASSVHDLGVVLDPEFCESHRKTNRRRILPLRQLRSIRRSLTMNSCHSLVRALIISRLDYCNGLLCGAPAFLLYIARPFVLVCFVLRRGSFSKSQERTGHISVVMKEQLQWLDIPARMRFKLCALVFRCLHGSAPPYLEKCCDPSGDWICAWQLL